MDSTLCLFLCFVVVLFEAFRPSLKIARSIENKPNLGTVTMLLSIGNNSSQRAETQVWSHLVNVKRKMLT